MDKNIFWLRQILYYLAIFLSIWIYALSCSKLLMLTMMPPITLSQPINVSRTDPVPLGNSKLLTSLNVVSLLLLMASNLKSLLYYFLNLKTFSISQFASRGPPVASLFSSAIQWPRIVKVTQNNDFFVVNYLIKIVITSKTGFFQSSQEFYL